MLSLLLRWLTVVMRKKACVAASASLEAPFVWIKSITVWLVVVRKASLLEGKVYSSTSKPFVDYNCLLNKASSYSVWSLPFLSNSNTLLQPVRQQHNSTICTVSRPALAATRAFPLVTTVKQRSSRESMCTPLFHLGNWDNFNFVLAMGDDEHVHTASTAWSSWVG